MRVVSALIAGVVLVALTGGAGAVKASAAGVQASAATVKITKKEWGLTLSRQRVPAGKVTFVVRNIGKLDHEFVVIRTNRLAKALPVEQGRAVETGRKGRIAKFGPGQTRRLILTLRPGKYVLICNLPAHYKAGQLASFRVV